jgi:YidC/Oxa1 family membrane protein insertase
VAADAVAGLLGRLVPVLPFLTVAALGFLPLAAGLYLVTTTAWTALEHLVLRRPPHPLTNVATSA